MSTLGEQVRATSARFESIIDRVCGACGNSCCHQGTMMGSQDLLRLHKGILLEEGREQIVREGLRARSAELRVDLAALEQVASQLADTLAGGQRAKLDKLADQLAAWREFCDFLDSDFEITGQDLRYLLRFSAIRANALRALRAAPGGTRTLAATAGPAGASFRLTGRRVAAPRCLFHAGGCIAGRWKPAKCASFFCTSEPNVLREISKGMSFEEFVLANFSAATDAQVLRAMEVELELGREYVAPKVIVGGSDKLINEAQAVLETDFKVVEAKREDSAFMLSSREAHILLDNLPDSMAYMRISRGVDGGALYELAVALDRLRIEGKALPFYLFAEQLNPPTVLTHPLWADGVMSQPLGALELYAVD